MKRRNLLGGIFAYAGALAVPKTVQALAPESSPLPKGYCEEEISLNRGYAGRRQGRVSKKITPGTVTLLVEGHVVGRDHPTPVEAPVTGRLLGHVSGRVTYAGGGLVFATFLNPLRAALGHEEQCDADRYYFPVGIPDLGRVTVRYQPA